MRSKRSLAPTSLAGVILATTLATGATPALCPIERDVVRSWQGAVAMYDQARRWTRIARWWFNPDAATLAPAHQPMGRTENVCQARPAAAVE